MMFHFLLRHLSPVLMAPYSSLVVGDRVTHVSDILMYRIFRINVFNIYIT